MIITNDGFPVNIPTRVSRYRANCSKDWGVFIAGDTGGMNVAKAEKAGLTRGSFVEMALCWTETKILTFKPHYFNEEFLEIWGIPVAGGMKDAFHEKASELSTFLMHRQSKDSFKGLLEDISRDAFNAWVSAGMEGDPNDFELAKISEIYFSKIFRFEMVSAESDYGPYHFLETTYRDPVNDLEFAALKSAKQIYDAQMAGAGSCTDNRLVQNQQECMKALNPSSAPQVDSSAMTRAKTKV
ncbi:hypothetical protein [Kamptonema sp. UHCC 0994]|uniref:hypothetical protein n=1 Tax=Kamptonema sp. UHCC 0994 TaxID=3031329 RepID=UPI0023B91FC3|nr:hypothetical protein [Kamptonema sp. UHCC 0994]MDF0553114.1 hypothetical protein [Kamptonema sp. UHCC 0994]